MGINTGIVGVTRTQQLREKNPFWRGGRSIASNGYVLIRVGVDHHLADVRGYAYEHRLVAEQLVGRRLLPAEHVHHRDGNKQNNAPENLEVVGVAEHRLRHRKRERGLRLPGEINPVIICACGCGQSFSRYDEQGRPRVCISGHNAHPQPRLDAIIQALKDGSPLHRLQIASAAQLSPGNAAGALSKLRHAGMVEPTGGGNWRLKTAVAA